VIEQDEPTVPHAFGRLNGADVPILRSVAAGILVSVLSACTSLGGSQVTVAPPFSPVEFGIDASGHIHISLNKEITTPLGRIGFEGDWSKALLDRASDVVPGKAEDGTRVLIDHYEDGRPQRDGYFLNEQGVVACLDGRFALGNDGRGGFLLQAEPDSQVKFVKAASMSTACAAESGDQSCNLKASLNVSALGGGVTRAGGPFSGVLEGDQGDCELLVFKYAPVAQKHFLGDRLEVLDGRFNGETGQIGSTDEDGEKGKSYLIEIVSAHSAVSRRIQETPRDANGDVAFDTLPPDTNVAASASVLRK
jgi:hypothetical protein